LRQAGAARKNLSNNVAKIFAEAKGNSFVCNSLRTCQEILNKAMAANRAAPRAPRAAVGRKIPTNAEVRAAREFIASEARKAAARNEERFLKEEENRLEAARIRRERVLARSRSRAAANAEAMARSEVQRLEAVAFSEERKKREEAAAAQRNAAAVARAKEKQQRENKSWLGSQVQRPMTAAERNAAKRRAAARENKAAAQRAANAAKAANAARAAAEAAANKVAKATMAADAARTRLNGLRSRGASATEIKKATNAVVETRNALEKARKEEKQLVYSWTSGSKK
jgi:hypothetical protein